MTDPTQIIDAVAHAAGLVTPVPPHAALGPAFVARCIAVAVAEARGEWERAGERTKEGRAK